MKTAIIGLPMTGKSSLFTILTGVHESARVGSMEARVGVARVPDPRLDELARIFQPPKVTHATVEYLDFPAISKEALREASYLASLRVVEALAHVLRLFEDDTVPHERGSIDPRRDLEDVDLGFRLRLRGHRCLYVPEAVARHVGSGTTARGSDFATYHGHRNLVWTFFKDMPAPLLLRALPALAARHAGGGPALLVVGDVVRQAPAWAAAHEPQKIAL